MIIHIQIKKNARADCDEHSFLFGGIGEIKGGDISEPCKKGGLPGYNLLICDILTFFQNSLYSGNEKRKSLAYLQ